MLGSYVVGVRASPGPRRDQAKRLSAYYPRKQQREQFKPALLVPQPSVLLLRSSQPSSKAKLTQQKQNLAGTAVVKFLPPFVRVTTAAAV